MKPSSSHCSGIALIGIIVTIVLMGLLGGSVLMLITTSSMESLQTLNWNRAFFAAESGVSAAKYQMTTNASWYVNLPRTTTGMIGQAFFSNNIATNAQSDVFITATGVQDDSRWTSKWNPSASEITRAIAVYKQGTQTGPRYRTCSNLRRLSAELTANAVSAAIQWQRIEANPRSNEFLLVVQDNTPRIWVQTYVNGAWGSNTLFGTSAVAAARGFDVAYESLSGRGMVVYSINSTNPQYRVWTSNTWSLPSNINIGANGLIHWVRLISKPGTNEIMCLARWRAGNNYSSAIVWNGSIWTNLTTLESNCASTINYDTMDAAYSTNSALVVYINGSTLAQRRSPKYRTYSNELWSSEKTIASVGANPSWIRVEYSADGAQAYACIMQASRYLYGAYWNGSAWGSYNTFSNVRLEIVSRRCFDIAWSSQSDALMVVYSLNQNAQSYLLATGGGSSNQYGSLASTDDGQWCVVKPDPFTSEFYYLAQDAPNRDVNFQRWTGAAWSLFPVLETATANNNYNFTDFAFRRDNASTNCWPLR